MQWGIAELINRPDVMNKVRKEIKSVVGNKLVEESDIVSLPYLQAVVKETLRLYPSVPISTRECRETCKIKGFDIPKKTMVAINIYAIMRDPELWENPNEFNPERFLLVDSDCDSDDHERFRYVPFGSGRRRCPGSMLATSLLNVSIAALVQCFDFKPVGDNEKYEYKINMEIEPGMSLARAHPLRVLPILHFTHPFAAAAAAASSSA